MTHTPAQHDSRPELTPPAARLLAALPNGEGWTTRRLAPAASMSTLGAQDALRELRAAGLVVVGGGQDRAPLVHRAPESMPPLEREELTP